MIEHRQGIPRKVRCIPSLDNSKECEGQSSYYRGKTHHGERMDTSEQQIEGTSQAQDKLADNLAGMTLLSTIRASAYRQPLWSGWCAFRQSRSIAAQPAVGIDLGTTQSVVSYMDGSEAKVIPDESGRVTIPSVVAHQLNAVSAAWSCAIVATSTSPAGRPCGIRSTAASESKPQRHLYCDKASHGTALQ